MTTAEHTTDFKLTRDTPHLTLTGKLWGVCCQNLRENWSSYNGSALYFEYLSSTLMPWYWPYHPHLLAITLMIELLQFELVLIMRWLNTLMARQHGRCFTDIFKCIILNENEWILIKMSMKFVPKGPINNIAALIQVMAWCWSGNKPLSQPMVIRLPLNELTHLPLVPHICVSELDQPWFR